MNKRQKIVWLTISFFVLCGCAPYTKINQLRPNMTTEEVRQILGPASSAQYEYAYGIYFKFSLYSYFDRNYYLVFIDDKLVSWGSAEELRDNLPNVVLYAKDRIQSKGTPPNQNSSSGWPRAEKTIPPSQKQISKPSRTRELAGIATIYDWDSFYLLEGTVLIADDGQLLGVITVNSFNSDSIINEFGQYGNKFNLNSIFNEFGQYGSKFSSLSPYNEFSSTPPKIYDRDGNFIAYFTVNKFKFPRVDPFLLVAWLKANK